MSRGFIEDASITGRKQAELYPYNIENAQGFYVEYGKDIDYSFVGQLPSVNDSRFEWSTVFIPYKKVGDIYEPYHTWIRFKIGKQGSWSNPVKIVGKDGRQGIDGKQGEKGKDGINGIDGIDGINGVNAPLVRIQYSVDGNIWTNSPGAAQYIRFSMNNGVSWESALQIGTVSLGTYLGAVNSYIDFPDPATLDPGDWMAINVDVTDFNYTYQSFTEGDTIYWDGLIWRTYDNIFVATKPESEDAASNSDIGNISNVKYITLRQLRYFIEYFKQLAHTFLLTIRFISPPVLDSLKSAKMLGTSADGTIIKQTITNGHILVGNATNQPTETPVDCGYTLFFSGIYEDVSFLLPSTFTVTSIHKGDVVTLQYSIDRGVNWITYTTPMVLNAGTIKWRATDIGSYSDASIVIKGTY